MTVRVWQIEAAALRRLAGVTLILLAVASSAFAQTTTVTATWDRNTDSDTTGYVVYYGTSSGHYQWTYDAGNQVSASLTLSRGFVYFMSVRAYGGDRSQGPSSNEASIDLNNGAPTVQIAASLASPNSAVVSWQTTNAVSASINGVPVGLNGSATVPISATTTYTLVAVGASGATATQQVTVTIDPSGVAPVAQISAGLAGDFLAQVSWQTANAVSATINGNPVPLSGTMMVPLTTVSASFALVATSATGATATGSAATLLNPGPAVATVSAVPTGAAVLVTWQTANAVSATLNGVAVPLTGSATVPLSTTTTFTLVAVNAAGAPTTQHVTATPSTGAPGTPTRATASVSGSRITLAWAAPASGGTPDNYLLYVGTSPGSANVLNGYPAGNVLSVAGDVPPGRYYAALRAANGAGMSDASDVLAIDVGASLPAPGGFAVAWRGATAMLSWSPAAVGTGRPSYYVIEAGTAPGAVNIGTISVGDVTSFEVELPPGTYYVRLRAVTPSGASLPSAELVLARP
ncbi:MAG: fibronectin type III domain-containing protein [Acidobacteriota bacterium]